MAWECHYVSLMSLERKEEPLLHEMSRKNKMGRKVATETITILSASAEVHRGPRLAVTFKVVPISWKPKCPE